MTSSPSVLVKSPHSALHDFVLTELHSPPTVDFRTLLDRISFKVWCVMYVRFINLCRPKNVQKEGMVREVYRQLTKSPLTNMNGRLTLRHLTRWTGTTQGELTTSHVTMARWSDHDSCDHVHGHLTMVHVTMIWSSDHESDDHDRSHLTMSHVTKWCIMEVVLALLLQLGGDAGTSCDDPWHLDQSVLVALL